MTSVSPAASTEVAGVSEQVAIVVGARGELGRATAEKLAAACLTLVGIA